jgi:3-methyladenine DNA glycosylase AlkD
MENIIARIRKDLEVNVDEKTKGSFQRFFKEKVSAYGVKTATVEKIAKNYWPEVCSFTKSEIYNLCEKLFASDFTEEAFVASFWLPRMIDRIKPSDIEIFKSWISKYINNWAKCDSFCNHTIGDLIEKYPELVEEVKTWAKSENRWLKRGAAVSLIVPAKKGKFLREAFEISDMLLADEDDLVQKGYGWLLKEESRKHQPEVFEYVLKNRKVMPRTALRYAIELMPKELKAKAMSKN